MKDDEAIRHEFESIFGQMYLSESETALRIFEYGYKAGVEAEREACAKLIEGGSFLHDDAPAARLAKEAAKAIRARGKK